MEVDAYNGFLGSNYAYEMLGWADKLKLKQEIEQFFNYIAELNINDLIDSIIEDLPANWHIDDETIHYIKRFLTSESRIHNIEEDVKNYITYLPSK